MGQRSACGKRRLRAGPGVEQTGSAAEPGQPSVGLCCGRSLPFTLAAAAGTESCPDNTTAMKKTVVLDNMQSVRM